MILKPVTSVHFSKPLSYCELIIYQLSPVVQAYDFSIGPLEAQSSRNLFSLQQMSVCPHLITAFGGFRRRDKENKWYGKKSDTERERASQKLIAFTFHPDQIFFIMQRGHSS